MGGMAAQIPDRRTIRPPTRPPSPRCAPTRSAKPGNGHDGTWVAHPDLVPVAMEVFDQLMPTAEPARQAARRRACRRRRTCSRSTRARAPRQGFRENIRVGVQYIEAWLRGRGAVPIYNLMEDAATAEICRVADLAVAPVRRDARGRPEGDAGPLRELPRRGDGAGEGRGRREAFDGGRFKEAIELFKTLSLAPDFEDFLTVPAYAKLG